MSIHKDCGRDVTWARRPDDPDRFLPPLEMTGFGYFIQDDGTAVQRPVFQMHVCDPDEVIDWTDRMRRLAEARADGQMPEVVAGRESWQAAREREREEVWEKVLPYPCDRCLQHEGSKCISMAQAHRKTGEMVELRNPHNERLKAAGLA